MICYETKNQNFSLHFMCIPFNLKHFKYFNANVSRLQSQWQGFLKYAIIIKHYYYRQRIALFWTGLSKCMFKLYHKRSIYQINNFINISTSSDPTNFIYCTILPPYLIYSIFGNASQTLALSIKVNPSCIVRRTCVETFVFLYLDPLLVVIVFHSGERSSNGSHEQILQQIIAGCYAMLWWLTYQSDGGKYFFRFWLIALCCNALKCIYIIFIKFFHKVKLYLIETSSLYVNVRKNTFNVYNTNRSSLDKPKLPNLKYVIIIMDIY